MSKLYTYITLVLLVFCGTMNAQELTVKSFTLAEMDITAQTSARQDNNGINCALVKVGFGQQGCVFEGGVKGDVENKTGEYWVYMPKGNRCLKIKHPNYSPLMVTFADYGIEKLESNRTYVLTIAPAGYVTQPADAGGNFYAISVTPKNAVMYIDNKQQEVSADGQYSAMLPYGTHSYKVEASGYISKEGTFDVVSGDMKPITISLASAMASVSISCPTPAVSLYVDKKLVGQGSWKGNLKEGMHLIEAKKDGYRSQQKTIQLAQQQTLDVTLDALSAIQGNLSVNYKPFGADVYIDGSKVGQSPRVFNGILVGNHKVEVKKDGYTSDTKTVSIAEGQTATLSGSLTQAVSTSTNSPVANSAVSTTAVAVDLGLSVKWATCNVGASRPEDYGDYYAWGEIKTKTDYSWKTYFDSNNKGTKFKKYNTEGGKTVLSPEDDVAHVKWGGKWRMPTDAELTELRAKCSWTWTTQNGVNGYKVTSKTNGNSIFLPAAGCRYGTSLGNAGSDGHYWSSSLDESLSYLAYYLDFNSGGVDWGSFYRYNGQSVRAVCP